MREPEAVVGDKNHSLQLMHTVNSAVQIPRRGQSMWSRSPDPEKLEVHSGGQQER